MGWKMAKKTSAQMIVNVSGGVLAVLMFGYMFVKYRYIDVPPTGCMEAYHQAVRFNLANREGGPISAIELQARAGNEEQGLMKNASVVRLDDAPVSTGLEIQAGRADAQNPASTIGINFPWRPQSLRNAQSACLRYSVFLPEDFDFGFGGYLPGFFGGDVPARSEQPVDRSFAARMMWTKDGSGIVLAQAKPVGEQGWRIISNPKGRLRLPRGRWTTIEQELVLNTPGHANGQMNVWVDGEKLLEDKALNLRNEEFPAIDGVANTVGFMGAAQTAPSGAQGKLRITSVDIGWR